MRIEDVLNGIVGALVPFGFPIYTEEVKQGLNRPCFYVATIAPDFERLNTNRRRKAVSFLIQYMPPDEIDVDADCWRIEDDLNDALMQINTIDGVLHGTNNGSGIVDGVLQHGIVYSWHEGDRERDDAMESSSIITGAR